jgi:peroxiredoxin
MSRFNKTVLVALMAIVAAACSHTAKIEGVIDGAPSSDVVVKMLDINKYQTLDTVRTDDGGRFSYKVEIEEGQPEFVYLFDGEKRIASLLLNDGDEVFVKADTLGNVSLEGSEESVKLMEIEKNFADVKAKMMDLSQSLSTASEDQAAQIRAELSKTYIDYYRSCVKYIMQNSRSMTVVPVLYQSFSETFPVFSQAVDAIHFKNMADSLELVYPDSRYVQSLRSDAEKRLSQMELMSRIASADAVDFLDIELPNQNGQKVKLSDVHKEVTLIYFWTASDAAQKMFNLDVLLPVYKKYHDKGFEIYQVSLDVDNGMWARVIKEQKLPWTNVSDISAGASRYVMAYNLSALPSAFLVGGNGMSSTKITDAASLSAAVEKALN